jgi:hypothetical protein
MLKRRNLLFTSAGDNTQFYKYWCNKNRNYDLFVCYYGDKNHPYLKCSDYYVARKGGKFDNFYHFWNLNKTENDLPFDIKDYDRYFILDDDIIISSENINKLFIVMEKLNLDVLQPSFDLHQSKLSYTFNISRPNQFLHFTNLIEVGVMMFNKKSLEKCMEMYEPSLITGYGLDYFFIWCLGKDKENNYAVIDFIKCINPKTNESNREIYKLEKIEDSVKKWKLIAEKHNIEKWTPQIFRYIQLKSK